MKFRIILFGLVLFSLLISQPIIAEDQQQYESEWIQDEETKQVKQVEKVDQSLYEEIETAMSNREKVFEVTYEGDTTRLSNSIQDTVETILHNNEYLSYDYKGYRFNYEYTSTRAEIEFEFKYYQTKEQHDYVEKRVSEIVDNIIEPSMNNHEKFKAIHDYVVLNLAYDESMNQSINAPYFALTNGETLCNGYAMLVYKMAKEVDIPVRLVSGEAGGVGHAWNLVQLDGEWFHLDATWDDPVPDEEGRTIHHYFMLTDDQLRQTHQWGEGGLNGYEESYPKATTNYGDHLAEIGEEEFAQTVGAHLGQDAYTYQADQALETFISNRFNQRDQAIRFRYNGDHVSTLKSFFDEIYQQHDEVKSFSYRWQSYPRTIEDDKIVTIDTIEYGENANEDPVQLEELVVESRPNNSLVTDDTFVLGIGAKHSDGTIYDVTRDVSYKYNDQIISIEDGRLTALNPGTTKVTVSYQDQSTTFHVTVVEDTFADYQIFDERENVPSDKTWTITFNQEVAFQPGQLEIVNQLGNQVDVNITANNEKVTVTAPEHHYNSGETYYMLFHQSLQSLTGNPLSEPVMFKFSIE